MPSFEDVQKQQEFFDEFMRHRRTLGMQHKTLACELGITARALTERITGRAGLKREAVLAMRQLVEERRYDQNLPGM